MACKEYKGKLTKWNLEDIFTRKERLKRKKDANRIIKIIRKLRKIKKNKMFGIINEANCEIIISLANKGNKEKRLSKKG